MQMYVPPPALAIEMAVQRVRETVSNVWHFKSAAPVAEMTKEAALVEVRYDVFALIEGLYPVESPYVDDPELAHDDVQQRLTLIMRIVRLARLVRQADGGGLSREQGYALRIAEDVVEHLAEIATPACPRSEQAGVASVMADVDILAWYENECESYNAAWPWEDLAYMQSIYAAYHAAVERVKAASEPDEIQAEVEAAFAALLQILQDAQSVIDTIA